MEKVSKEIGIKLIWFQEMANVIDQNNGRSFEIGVVALNTVENAIIGCTYYHHMLPSFEGAEGASSLLTYQERIGSHQQDLEKIMNNIRKLYRDHPEVSVERLSLDDPDDPQFFDLAIPIKFPVPLLRSDSYMAAVQEKVVHYATLLGPLHVLEILHAKSR